MTNIKQFTQQLMLDVDYECSYCGSKDINLYSIWDIDNE